MLHVSLYFRWRFFGLLRHGSTWYGINFDSICKNNFSKAGIHWCLFPGITGLGTITFGVYALIQLSINGLVKVSVIMALIFGICASGAGSVKLTLDLFGNEFLSQGNSSEIIACVMAIASSGLDSLPCNGAVIMLFMTSGGEYRKG